MYNLASAAAATGANRSTILRAINAAASTLSAPPSGCRAGEDVGSTTP